MPNPFASQAPLSPSVGAAQAAAAGGGHRTNPFASSAPLASSSGKPINNPPFHPADLGLTDGHHGGTPHVMQTTAGLGPPPTSVSGSLGVTAGPGVGGSTTAPATTTRSPYPTPPEMHQQGAPPPVGVGGGAGGFPPPAYGGGFGGAPVGVGTGADGSGWGTGAETPAGYGAAGGFGGAPAPPSLFVPATAGLGMTGAAGAPMPTLFIPTAAGRLGGGAPESPAGGTNNVSTPPFEPPPAAVGLSYGAGLPKPATAAAGGAPPISLRGRERYCSGGAWVGPAPEWPKPPADATIGNADTSRVRPEHRRVVTIISQKHAGLMAGATGARRKELEGISTKLGGLFVFLNEGEGEAHISAPVAEQLALLCDAMAAGDAGAVSSHLLFISTHHWEEAAYWFPALKRLTKL